MALNCKSVIFESQDNIGKIRSSDWAERGFCTKCGSNLFYHIVESSDYQIAAGLFDDQSMLRMSLQVFTDRKPEFYEFANETKSTPPVRTAFRLEAISVSYVVKDVVSDVVRDGDYGSGGYLDGTGATSALV